jgi:DNA-binding winged helix-turn-helix (wHTH) protein
LTPGSFRFDRFLLDPGDRLLCRDGAPVDLNGRYLDALALLVREHGRLVPKDRFFDEVWRGVPVTDEALTQCIRTLRRQLGDSATRPRFIETVPKHGYRFIAPVQPVEEGSAAPGAAANADWPQAALQGIAGTLGGGFAGMVGGLLYGFGGVAQSLQAGMGATSVLLVLVCITAVVGLLGGVGVSFGIAAARLMRGNGWLWSVIGGAVGGLVVGALVKMVGLDAFSLLFGRSPGEITGAGEGALLGGAVGLGVWWGRGRVRRCIIAAGLSTGAAGLLIPLLGGRLMGGSLDLLAHRFPGSRLRLDGVAHLFGEPAFGHVSQIATAGLEGLLFGGCVAGAMALARRRQLTAISLDQA